MGADQNFFRNSNRRPISQNHHKPSRVLDEVWNSYGRAKPTQHTPRTSERKTRKQARKSADLADSDRSDRSLRPVRPVGLEFKNPDRSDRFQRPVRPVSETGQTGCTQTDRKQSFKRQILSKQSPNPTKLGG